MVCSVEVQSIVIKSMGKVSERQHNDSTLLVSLI